MVSATLQAHAQITLKNKPPVQTNVPKRHAQEYKSSKLLVHALTVLLMKRPLLMVKDVKLTAAQLINIIPQMLYAMTPPAQNTSNLMLTLPKNALQRHMHVQLTQITLRKLHGTMMLEPV